VDDEVEPRTYRRTAAAVYSMVAALGVLGIALAVTIQSDGRDWVAPWAVAVPIAALIVASGVLPKLVTTPSHVEVHNMFTRITVPYPVVVEAVDGRRGVAVRIVSGRPIPVVAFGRSSLADLFTGNAEAHRAVGAVNARIAGTDFQSDDLPAIERRMKVPVIGVVGASLLFPVAALLLA
jgi:hypothetical protein